MINNFDLWVKPKHFHKDSDADWEISNLQKLAKELFNQSSSYRCILNLDDQTCIYVELWLNNIKTGEAYVNRIKHDSNEPMFSIFFEESEFHDKAITTCVEKLKNSKYFEE